MEAESVTLGQKIKRYRLVNDIRQEDLAEKMGISRATLINYEKGHTTINVDVLNRLKKCYPDFEIDNNENEKPKIIEENIINFKVLSNVLSKGKAFIISVTILSAFTGLSLSFLFTKYYDAEISLYPAKKDLTKNIGQLQSLALNLGINPRANDQSFNIPDVVKSRLIANKVVKKRWTTKNGQIINLTDLWNLDKVGWMGKFIKKKADSLAILDGAVNKFDKHVKVNEDRLSGLIKISTTFQDPILAADIANFIGNEVERYIQKENSAQSNKEKLFIFDRLSIVKSELEVSELELKKFKERNRGYEDSPELFMLYSQLFREVEAKKQVYLTLQQQLELARIEEVKQSPILHILDYAVPATKKSSPNRLSFVIISSLLGVLISSFFIIFRY